MAAVHREVERAYPAAPDADLPALVDLVPDGGTPLTESVTTDVLTATYVDTADLRLTAAGLTLRDRSGGRDAGWHLKVPAAGRGARTEVRHPPGGPGHVVPEPLQALVRAVTTGEPLHPVAEVVTRRRAVRLVDATGRVLLELADDHVTARRLRPAEGGGSAASAPVTWREVEIELVDGDEDLLDVVEDGLRAAGLGPARSGTKVGRVLPAPDAPARATPDRRSSAGEVLAAYLAAQVHRLVEQDLAVRLDAPDAVHQMRVAARRLRTALRTFRPLLDREVTDPLRDELRLLGRVLGTARDAQVLRDRVADLDEAPVADLDARHRTAQEAVLRALGSTRYLTLVRGLTALAADPPLRDRPRTRRRATRVLPALVARRDRKVRRAL
ncbi:CYTH and CHAD domain-containing protein, partial [Cellulomonas triticagri]